MEIDTVSATVLTGTATVSAAEPKVRSSVENVSYLFSVDTTTVRVAPGTGYYGRIVVRKPATLAQLAEINYVPSDGYAPYYEIGLSAF
mgnify:CR=1 FL=1|jgi:hypothetical protein